MKKAKSSVPGSGSYKGIGGFRDKHDLTDFWERIKEASFKVDAGSELTYYA